MIEDAALGLCLNIHQTPRVQCDCFVQNQGTVANKMKRCGAPISFHPVKSVSDYLGFTRWLSARAEHHLGVNISYAKSTWASWDAGPGPGANFATRECQITGVGCFPPYAG